MQTFNIGTDGADIHLAPVNPDIIIGIDRDQDVRLLLHLRRWRIGLIDVNTGLFNKACGDNKKYQHDKDHIDKWSQIDL